jgi:hypothetical protein
VEARGRGRRGENLGEGKGQERIGRRSSGNTVFVETDSPIAQTLGAAAVRRAVRFAESGEASGNSMKGQGVVRRISLSERENLCRSEAQGRHPHETRRGGLQAE